MKKSIFIIMIISLVFIFVACGNTGTDNDPTPTATANVTAEPTVEPEPTEEPTPAPTRVPDPEVDGVIFNFIYENDHGFGSVIETQHCDHEWVEGKGLAILPVSEDPWVMIDAIGPNNEEVNILDYPVFKIRFMNKTPGTNYEMFLKRAGDVSGEDLVVGPSVVANNDEFVDVIIDLSQAKNEAFLKTNNGVVTAVRLDIVNLSPAKAEVEEKAGDGSIVIYVDYFGFFKTVEEATEWVPTHLAD